MQDLFFVARRRDYLYLRTAVHAARAGLSGCGDTLRIAVIVPDGEVDVFRAMNLGVEIIAEGTIDERFSSMAPSWDKQQLVKLFCHRVMRGEAAFIADSDTFLTKSISSLWGDLPPLYIESQTGDVHPRWHQMAREFLGLGPNIDSPSIFPTPNVMTKSNLQALHDFVAQRYEEEAFTAWSRRMGTFTEWATYGTFVMSQPDCRKAQPAHPITHAAGIWDYNDWNSFNATEQKTPWLVAQSALEIPWPELYEKLKELPLIPAWPFFDSQQGYLLVPETPVSSADVASFHEEGLARQAFIFDDQILDEDSASIVFSSPIGRLRVRRENTVRS